MSKLFIISGPSGAGEDSIITRLKKIMPIERVITTTTRSPRPGESNGDPYYFISPAEFQADIKQKKFFEYAQEYNDNYYGVTFEEIERVKNSGKIGIWKIEYKGVITAKKLLPGITAILINAPLKTLEQRIRRRDRVTEKFVAERIRYTEEWLKHKDIYDYEVTNEEGKLEEAIQKVVKIIKQSAFLDKK
jgi:guanylate kinase